MILDIQPLSINTSSAKQPTLAKPTSNGIRTFFGVRPKISKYTKSPTKQPNSAKETTYKPSNSDPHYYKKYIQLGHCYYGPSNDRGDISKLGAYRFFII